jgi:pimeloyl-ACP methyl ester carboxylesterase
MKLFYREFGNGPFLIILHGLFGSSDNWVSIAKKLSDTFTVILPDQRNHGNSPHSEIHNYSAMRDDLHELTETLSIDKFYLAGHSMGGKTAVSFALKWPEMLNGLLVADISPFRVEDEDRIEFKQHEKILKAMLALDLSKISSREQAIEALREYDLPEYTIGFILKNLQRNGRNNFTWKINAAALLSNMNNIMKGVDRDSAFSNQVTGFPVIFLKGEKSSYLPEEDYDDIRKMFPAAEFIEIKNAGHWVHSDNPEAVINSFRMIMY